MILFISSLEIINVVIPYPNIFSNGPRSLPRNPSDFPILCNLVFDNFTLAEELFAKTLRSFETCALVNNNHTENYSYH